MSSFSESSIGRLLDDITDLILVGFLWLLCSVPVVTLAASGSALYYTVVKVVRRKHGTVIKEFFHSFKENFWQGLVLTILYLLYAGMIVVFVSLTAGDGSAKNPQILLAALILVLPFLMTVMYICPVVSRFQGGTLTQLRYAFFFSLAHPFTTVLLLLWSLTVGAVIYAYSVMLGILPGIYVYVCSLLIENVFKKHMKNQEAQYGDEEEKPWYL